MNPPVERTITLEADSFSSGKSAVLNKEGGRQMPLHTILIKPVSGLCNMRCDYCFYCDEMAKREVSSYGMMSEDTLKNIIKKAMRQARGEICFAFQGGEPTLRGIEFFQKAAELEERFNRGHIRVINTIQTNGLGLDEEWCRFFHENDFLVGVSVDGTAVIHDTYRHDASGNPTYERIKKNIDMLEAHKVEYNILTVVTGPVAEHIREIYGEYKKSGWNYQQYIACLDPIDEEPGGRPYSLTPETYGRFLAELFRMWDKDWKRGKAPYIRQFENYIGILMGYAPEACEQRGVCSVQCVAEADGSAYPCDFYALDKYRLGDYNRESIQELLDTQTAADFVKESRKLHADCGKCEWYSLCRGGCRRHRVKVGENGLYKNYFCEGYKSFFERCGGRMKEIADFMISKKR